MEDPILGVPYALKRSRRRLSSDDDPTLAEIESWTALPASPNIARCYFWGHWRGAGNAHSSSTFALFGFRVAEPRLAGHAGVRTAGSD